MRGGVLKYAAQATSQIDAEIGKKDHFWMETTLLKRMADGKDPARAVSVFGGSVVVK